MDLVDVEVEPGWLKVEHLEPIVINPFTEASGPTDPLPPDAPAIDFLYQMVGAEFFGELATATNANAVHKHPPVQPTADNLNATSDPHWHPTTADEMKAFVGINIAMGVKDLPEYRDYWSEEPILHDAYVANVMSRHRYEKLVQYFHLHKNCL